MLLQEEKGQEEDPLKQLKGQKMVKCRICKDDHWTTQCPYKDKLGTLPDLLKEEPKPSKFISIEIFYFMLYSPL